MGQRTLVEANNHFPNILSMTEIKARLIERKEILYFARGNQEYERFAVHTLFICYNRCGWCRYRLLRNRFFKKFSREEQYKNGTSLAMKDAGSNAISLSMEQQALSVVIGAEHCNRVFSELACVCTPLRIKM